jgi:pyruvate formate lyase activating enzyme
LILDNLELLSKKEKVIWVRMPVIPGVNDDVTNLELTAKFMNKNKLNYLFLLPYHNIAIDKYERLGKKYKDSEIKTPSDKYMNQIKKHFENYGINTKIGG